MFRITLTTTVDLDVETQQMAQDWAMDLADAVTEWPVLLGACYRHPTTGELVYVRADIRAIDPATVKVEEVEPATVTAE